MNEHTVEVGDIFGASWGYDQTNVDFYKVVRVSAKSVWVVRIGAKVVPGTEEFMSARLRPDPDVVINDTPTMHRILPKERTGYSTLSIKVRSFGVWAHKIDPSDSLYSSWYA